MIRQATLAVAAALAATVAIPAAARPPADAPAHAHPARDAPRGAEGRAERRMERAERREERRMLRAERRGRHGESRGGAAMVERLDADGDGLLTRAEIEAGVLRWLSAEDGPLDLAALEAALAARDGDGRSHRAARLLRRLDANGDGVVDAGELAAHRARMAERMLDRMGAGPDGTVSRDDAARAWRGHGRRDG